MCIDQSPNPLICQQFCNSFWCLFCLKTLFLLPPLLIPSSSTQAMAEPCDLKVHINGQHTFFINQRILCGFSMRLRKMAKQEKKRSHLKGSGLRILDFPGGANGFELALRFCYNNGRIPMSPSNVSALHCSAVALDMSEEASACNLQSQAETFLDGLFYWTWDDILTSIRSCEPFVSVADSSGLLSRLISALLAKISANSEAQLIFSAVTPLPSSSSSSSSPDTSGFRSCSSTKNSDPSKPGFSREWWFDGLTLLSPTIIEKIMRTLGAYGADNKNLILTRFLLHYLKAAAKRAAFHAEYGGLADTVVHGVVLMGRGGGFSCRGLFSVLRVVSGLGISRECRRRLEMEMGMILDQATLDDLLVSGNDGGGGVYDVNLVMRLVRVFVEGGGEGVSVYRMRKAGRLVDKYLGEISPDQSLKVSKFLAMAESLPDSARECFDGVYRALDIYLESHPSLSSEERTTLCRCLNYEKLTLEACKDLAKNPRIPPGVAIQALVSQQSKLQINDSPSNGLSSSTGSRKSQAERPSPEVLDEEEDLRLNLKRMQNRVMELEKVCREMKGQMSRMGKGKPITSLSHHSSRGLARLC